MSFGIAALAPYAWLLFRVKTRHSKMHGQLADILMILAGSLRAGHSFFESLDMVAKEVGEPGSEEFGRVVSEIRLGRSVDDALNALSERIGSEDFKWALLAVNIQRQVGGNLAEVLDTVATTMRERETVRRQVDVLATEGKMSMYILGGLPFGIGGYMLLVNPEYLSLLWTTQIGLVMSFFGAILLACGFAWMKKVVKVDV
jgi:tight adherence protein B